MKLLLLTFLLLLTPTEEYKWVAELMADYEEWYQSIANGLTTQKSLDYNGHKIIYYTQINKELNGHLLTVKFDTIGFSYFRVDGLCRNDQIQVYHTSFIDTLTNDRTDTQQMRQYKWRWTTYYFSDKKNGLVDQYEILINNVMPTRADSIALFSIDKTRNNVSATTYNKLLTQLEADKRRITE